MAIVSETVSSTGKEATLLLWKTARLAKKAPARIAGHNCRPKRNSSTSAKPDGGQIGLALLCASASIRPSRASR